MLRGVLCQYAWTACLKRVLRAQHELQAGWGSPAWCATSARALVVPKSGSVASDEVILCLVCSPASLFQGLYLSRCACHSSLHDLHWDIQQHHDKKHSK